METETDSPANAPLAALTLLVTAWALTRLSAIFEEDCDEEKERGSISAPPLMNRCSGHLPLRAWMVPAAYKVILPQKTA